MDLWSGAKVVGRHWVVVSIGLVITSAVLLGLAVRLPTSYSAKATVLVLPPRLGGVYQPVPAASPSHGAPSAAPAPSRIINPYLSFDSSLYALVGIIVRDLNSDDTKERLKTVGADAKYEVLRENDFPAFTVVVTGTNRDRIAATVAAVTKAGTDDLTSRQKETGVPQDTWATASPSGMASVVQSTDKLKALLAAAVLGLLAAVSLAFILEGLQVASPEEEPKVPRRVSLR